jgi:hypothetical protein
VVSQDEDRTMNNKRMFDDLPETHTTFRNTSRAIRDGLTSVMMFVAIVGLTLLSLLMLRILWLTF